MRVGFLVDSKKIRSKDRAAVIERKRNNRLIYGDICIQFLLILFEQMGNTFDSLADRFHSSGEAQENNSNVSLAGRSTGVKGIAQKVSQHKSLKRPAQETLKNLHQFFDEDTVAKYQPAEGPIYHIKNYNATYQGKYEKGNPNGRGVAHFQDGGCYIGDFVEGDANGRGLYIYPNGSVYEGNFVNSKFGGNGTLNYIETRMKYEGQFLNGLPHGQGRQTYFDKGYYEGEFQKGQKHGNGIYQWANGTQYQGNFEYGLMHGKGVLKNRNEIIYQGNFVKGRKTGYGVFRTEAGTYEGNFDNDLLNGNGTFIWNDGKMYEGEFKNTMMDGRGRMLYTTNQVAEGEWEKNHNKALTDVRNESGIRDIMSQIESRHQAALRPGFLARNSSLSNPNESSLKESGVSGFISRSRVAESQQRHNEQIEQPVAYDQPRAGEYA